MNSPSLFNPYRMVELDEIFHLIDLDEINDFIINLAWTDVVLRGMSDIK